MNNINCFTDIFDVVRDSKDHVYLLDFSPFGDEWTDPLAFEWSDLIDVDDEVRKLIELHIRCSSDTDMKVTFKFA